MAETDKHCATCHCSPTLPNYLSEPSNNRLDERIQALRKELHLLCSYRNTLARINQLPNEILLQIFHCVIAEPDFAAPVFRELTSITSICAHWRTIAIEDSTLWTRITSSSGVNAIKCMVERSKSALVSVELDYRYRGSYDWEFFEIGGRLQRLEAIAEYTSEIEEVMRRLESVDGFPLLESMSLECRNDMSHNTLVFNAPNLSTLRLYNMTLQEPPSNYSTAIRHFKAHYEGSDILANLSLTQWVDFLSAMPNLETLDLRYPIFREDETLKSDKRVVSLAPSLRKFALRESVNDGTGFLRHFNIPVEATLDLIFHVFSDDEVEAQVGVASSAIEPLIKSHNAINPLHSLTLFSPAYLEEPHLKYSFSSPCHPLWLSETEMSFTIICDGETEDPGRKLSDLVMGMKPATSVSHLSELAVDGSSRSVFYALQQYEWAETLILFGALWPRCLEELLTREREERISALSKIHTLVLRGVPFHWAERSNLLDFLEGTTIHTVRVEMSTGVSQEDINALREKVEVVTWDEGGDLANRFSGLSIS